MQLEGFYPREAKRTYHIYTKKRDSGAAGCEGWARERGYLRQGKEGGAGNSLHIAKAADAAFAH